MNKKRSLVIGFILIFGLAFTGATEAADIRYTPYLMLNGEYNDNILFLRNDKISDYLLNVAPALTVDYKTELLKIESEAGVLFRRYLTETEFDREDYYVNLSSSYRMTERLSMISRLYYLQDNTLESSVIDLNGPPVVTDDVVDQGDNIEPGVERFYSGRKQYNAFAMFSYGLTELSNLELGYRYLKTDYNFVGNTDYDVQRIRLAFLRRLEGQRDTVGARMDFAYYTSDVSDADSYAFAVIWRHLFTETMALKADIGARYTDRTFNNTDLQTNTWTGLANIRFIKLGETTTTNIGFKMDLQSGSGGSISNVPRLYGDFKQALTERFLFQCIGNFYLKEDDVDFNFGDGYLVFDILPSLKYRLTENYSLTLAYSFTYEHDNELTDNRDIKRNRVWLMLELEFPEKL